MPVRRTLHYSYILNKHTPINKKVHTPSKETVMKPAVFELGFRAFKIQLQPWQANTN